MPTRHPLSWGFFRGTKILPPPRDPLEDPPAPALNQQMRCLDDQKRKVARRWMLSLFGTHEPTSRLATTPPDRPTGQNQLQGVDHLQKTASRTCPVAQKHSRQHPLVSRLRLGPGGWDLVFSSFQSRRKRTSHPLRNGASRHGTGHLSTTNSLISTDIVEEVIGETGRTPDEHHIPHQVPPPPPLLFLSAQEPTSHHAENHRR